MPHLRLGQYQDLLLVPAFAAFFDEDKREPGGGVSLTYRVEEDVEELAARIIAAGAHVVEGPVDKPCNARGSDHRRPRRLSPHLLQLLVGVRCSLIDGSGSFSTLSRSG